MQQVCAELITLYHAEQAERTAFAKAAAAIDTAVGGEVLDRDLVRTQSFTDAVAADTSS